MKNKGFTLIELLVVIAIIGMLSSLAVISLNGARNKAKDAQIQSDLSQIRTYATVEYPDGEYGSLAIPTQLSAPTGSSYNLVVSTDTGVTAYAVHAPLIADTGNSFCVDSTGNAKVIATTAIPVAAVTPLTVVCP